MKTLMLRGGDLVIGPAGHQTITGVAKIRQDLALALGEPYGNDRFHPGWGSVLPGYIGSPIEADSEMLVRSETSRVVANYIAIQRDEVLNDALRGSRARYGTDDVVTEVTDVTAEVSMDTIRVRVDLLTQSQKSVTIGRTVGSAT